MSKTKLTAGALSYLDDLLRGLRGEAIDATPKLGSGKNLEALQRMQDDIADAARKSEAPSYPKNIVQDDLAAKQGFTLEGQPYTKEGTIVPEGTDLPALRTQTLPETPSSFEPGTIETPFKQITEADELAKLRETGPNYTESITKPTGLADTAEQLKGTVDFGKTAGEKARDIAVLGASGLALSQMGGEEKATQPTTEIPFRPEVPSSEKEQPTLTTESEPLTVESEKQQIPIQKTQEVSPNITEEDKNEIIKIGQKLAEDPSSVTEEEIDYLKMLMSAQENDNQSRFVTNLLRAGTTIGAAIAGVKPDYSGVDALEKQIGTGTKQVAEMMSVDSSQKKLEAAKRELEDDKALRDPQSEISKQLRNLLRKAGYPIAENVSAKNLKDMGINPYNILTSIESARIASESRKEASDIRKEASEDRKESKARSEITSMVTNFNKSKDFERYNTAKDALDSLNLAIESGDKTAIGSAFMKFAKEAQGDDSVVRDGDMRILAGGYNFLSPTQMITKLAAKAKGGDFNKTELQQMKKVVEMGITARQKRIQQQASPIFSRIEKNNMDESIFFDPTLASEIKGKQSPSETQPTQQSDTVRVRRILDGKVVKMNRSQAVNMDKNKYKILD